MTAGIKSITDVAASSLTGLTEIQRRICESVQTNTPYLDKEVKSRLRDWGMPLHFLDFETIAPALPAYIGTTPYLEIPFQWSLHTLHEDGSLEHREFLFEGSGDPRPTLAEALLEAIASKGQVVHYSHYEATIFNRLKVAVPHLAKRLQSIERRLKDLAPLVREHYYHPAMQGSFSLKAVYPSLCPGQSYDEEEINNGTMASRAFVEMNHSDTTEQRRSELRDALLSYCRLDTAATVSIYNKLVDA